MFALCLQLDSIFLPGPDMLSKEMVCRSFGMRLGVVRWPVVADLVYSYHHGLYVFNTRKS